MSEGEGPINATLTVLEGPASGQRGPFVGELLIGRSAAGIGALAGDELLSRRHAIIRRDRDGRVYVADLDSRSATWVNEGPRLTIRIRIPFSPTTAGAGAVIETLLTAGMLVWSGTQWTCRRGRQARAENIAIWPEHAVSPPALLRGGL